MPLYAVCEAVMASLRIETWVCLLALLPFTLGQKCGYVDLNTRSIAVAGNVTAQSEENNPDVIVVRVSELIHGDANANEEIKVAQVRKAKSCGHVHKLGDQRIFIIETRPGNKKYVLTNSLPLSMRHLVENANRGK